MTSLTAADAAQRAAVDAIEALRKTLYGHLAAHVRARRERGLVAMVEMLEELSVEDEMVVPGEQAEERSRR